MDIKKIKEAGASMSVIGSYITNNDINEKVRELKDITSEEWWIVILFNLKFFLCF